MEGTVLMNADAKSPMPNGGTAKTAALEQDEPPLSSDLHIADQLIYMADLAAEMEAIANQQGFETLAGLFRLAQAEANLKQRDRG